MSGIRLGLDRQQWVTRARVAGVRHTAGQSENGNGGAATPNSMCSSRRRTIFRMP